MTDLNLPDFDLPVILGLSAIALFIILYTISKMVYVERGILPLALKAINRFFEIVFAELKYFGGFLFGYTKEEMDDFLANENLLKGLSNTITGVAVILVVFSFLASYSASKDFVVSRGISEGIAFAIPLGIDGFIVLLILFISYQSLKGEGTIFGRVFLAVFTGMSIYFNISHLESNFGLWTFAHVTAGAIAPAIVFIGMEVVSSVQKAQVLRSGLVRTDAELKEKLVSGELSLAEGHRELAETQTEIEASRAIIAGIDEEVAQHHSRKGELSQDIVVMESAIEKLDILFLEKVPNATDRLERVKILSEAGYEVDAIAEQMNIKVSSVQSYLRSVQNGAAS